MIEMNDAEVGGVGEVVGGGCGGVGGEEVGQR